MARPTTEEVEERKQFMQVVTDCATDPSKFSEVFLNHKLFDYNKKYVNCKDRFIVYRSGRQVGKTMSTAVKAIHFAFFAPIMLETVKDECTIVIAAPTQNQATIMSNITCSKLEIRRKTFPEDLEGSRPPKVD